MYFVIPAVLLDVSKKTVNSAHCFPCAAVEIITETLLAQAVVTRGFRLP